MQQKHWMNLRASTPLHTYTWTSTTSTSEYLLTYIRTFIHTRITVWKRKPRRSWSDKRKAQAKVSHLYKSFLQQLALVDAITGDAWLQTFVFLLFTLLLFFLIVFVVTAVGIVIVLAITLTAAATATNLARLSLNTIVTVAVPVTVTLTVGGVGYTPHTPPHWWPIFRGTSAVDSITKTMCNCRHSTVSSSNNSNN